MKPTSWILAALAVLLVLGTGATAWRVRDAREVKRVRAGTATPATKLTRHAPAKHGDDGTRRSLRDRTGLPRAAELALLQLEDLARIQQEAEDLTTLTLELFDEEARLMVMNLSAEDLEALIMFYESPLPDGLVVESEGMFLNPLYEAWGESAPETAQRRALEAIRGAFEAAGGKVVLDDPFAAGPGTGPLSAVFAGWARRDPHEALAAWEGTRAGLGYMVAGDLSAVDYKLFAGWSRVDPKAAYSHLNTSPPADELRYRAQLRGFAGGLDDYAPWEDLAAQVGHDRLGNLASLFGARWAQFDPDAAVAWMRGRDPLGEEMPRMFAEWRHADGGTASDQWLANHAERLPPEARAEIFTNLAAGRFDYLERAIGAVRSLPPSERAWGHLERFAHGEIDPFAPESTSGLGIAPERVRALMDEMQAPDEVRARIETILRDRDRDPFTSPESR